MIKTKIWVCLELTIQKRDEIWMFFLQADGIYDDPLELLDIRPELSDDEALNEKVILLINMFQSPKKNLFLRPNS